MSLLCSSEFRGSEWSGCQHIGSVGARLPNSGGTPLLNDSVERFSVHSFQRRSGVYTVDRRPQDASDDRGDMCCWRARCVSWQWIG